MKKEDSLKGYIKNGLIGLSIGLFLQWLAVLIFVRPSLFKCFDLSTSGQIGDTISGITAPIIGTAGIVVTFLAFFIQFKANKLQFTQFKAQNDITIRNDKTRVIEWLMEKNREIVSQMKINEMSGVKVFHAIVNEFMAGYKFVEKHVDDQFKDQYIGITYLLLYNGIGKLSNSLNNSLLGGINNLAEVMTKIEEYSVWTYGRKKSSYKYFQGHQVRLGNYFRNLFQIYSMIQELDRNLFSDNDKYQLGKYLRSQMSTYEQMLIFFNSQAIYGKPMIDKNIISDFKLIKNIPLPMLEFCIGTNELKDKFKEIDFEWLEIQNRSKPVVSI